MTIAQWIAAAVWCGLFLKGLADVLALRSLPRDLPAARPRVSAVLAVRDEAERIDTTVRRLLAQQHVEIEVVAVDDRSSDATPAILAGLAREDSRLRVLRVDALPPRWLGKTHACEQGARAARGDWLLFTDGDTWLGPDVVARAVAAAERERAEHVVLCPGFARATAGARAVLAAFGLGMSGHMARVNRDRGAIGIGAFNLVHAEAWRAVGGHAALRLEVVDDMRLGALLARAGFRTRAYDAAHDVEVEWGATVPGILRGLEKNLFAHYGYSVGAIVAITAFLGALFVLALAGPWTGTLPGWIAFGGFAALSIPGAILCRRARASPLPGLLLPLGGMVLVAAMVRSMWVTLRRGGVRWRDTFHPLAELRAGRVR